jgi:hypothetical protein
MSNCMVRKNFISILRKGGGHTDNNTGEGSLPRPHLNALTAEIDYRPNTTS